METFGAKRAFENADLTRLAPNVPKNTFPKDAGASPIKALAALDAKAVAAEVVMAAGRADQAPRRVRLQPPLIFSAVPDAVFGPEHPAASFTVEDR